MGLFRMNFLPAFLIYSFMCILFVLSRIFDFAIFMAIPAILVGLWFLYYIYNDAKKRGLNENWFFIVLFLGPIGALIYYLVAKDHPREQV